MENERRLIDANALVKAIRFEHDCIMQDPEISNQMKWRESVCYQRTMRAIENAPIVDAVVLPYHPRPMLKDRNPHNTDVYCPECGTDLSGYYGGEPLPIVTCFECGEILDPYKATTKTDGERKDNGKSTGIE